MVAEVLRGYLAHLNVSSDLGDPKIEKILVTHERVGTETFGSFVQEKAEKGICRFQAQRTAIHFETS
jgi:hypothetical protein